MLRYLKIIDRTILKWAYQRPYRNSTALKALIFMGDGPFWMIVVFIAALAGQLLEIRSFHHVSLILMAGFVISNVSFLTCKTFVRRRRPYANAELQEALQIHIRNRDPGHASREFESFPSGHVLWTTLSVCLICINFGYVAVLLSGWMIPATVYLRPHLGVHYPSDVLAGLVLACINVAITVLVFPFLVEYINCIRCHPGYSYGYWAFIFIFLFAGFKTWLRRV